MEHPHGTFCWMDTYVPDPERGKAFYSQLFGWEGTDIPMSNEGQFYTVFSLDGQNVGALGPPVPALPQGTASHWLSYIATDHMEATAEQAKALGAKFLMGPDDVGAGLTALMQDPWGALVLLWQAKVFGGADAIRRPGTMGWTELYTRDLERTQSFYTSLFGWEWSSMPMDQGGNYHLAALDEVMVCGLLEMDENWGDIPSHWMVYIQVEDAAAAAAKVTSLGGDICVPVTEISVGRFAVVNDDQKVTFTIFEPS